MRIPKWGRRLLRSLVVATALFGVFFAGVEFCDMFLLPEDGADVPPDPDVVREPARIEAVLEWQPPFVKLGAEQTDRIYCQVEGSRCGGGLFSDLGGPHRVRLSYLQDPSNCAPAKFKVYVNASEELVASPEFSCIEGLTSTTALDLVDLTSEGEPGITAYKVVLEGSIHQRLETVRTTVGTEAWQVNIRIWKHRDS